MKLASGFCIPEPLPVHTGIKRRQVHRSTSDESHGAVPREGDVHHGGPGAPSLAKPGRDEDVDKAHFLDAPISKAGLFGNTIEGPAVLGGTAADRGDPAHLQQ